MSSPHISTPVVDIFTRSFVIPNDVSFIFNRQPDGYRYIACIPARGSNDRPLFVCADGFLKIIDSVEAWVKNEYVSSETAPPTEIRGDSLRGYNRIDVAFTASDNVKSIDVRNYWLSLIHISEPTRLLSISYAVF